MRRFGTVMTAAAALSFAALAYAQTTPTQSSRLAALVPSDMSATEACDGFKSMTECAAALHAAQNVGIPFRDLKSKMTGGEKLGAAIHDLKPGADVRSQVSRAQEQAEADLRAPQHSAPQG
jgi:hypothetical protein